MPDNLRITTPINNTEGVRPTNPANDTSRASPVNPSRVPRANGSESEGSRPQDLLLDRMSVYSKFIEQLEQSPSLERTLQKLMSDAAAVQNPGFSSLETDFPVSSPLRALISAMAAQEDGMLKSLTDQEADATLFTGQLFKLLGQISSQRSDPQFDLRLANFLKAYTGYTTSGEITRAIRAELAEVRDTVPVPFAKRLAAVMEKLSDGTDRRFLVPDLLVLKKEVIPLLSEYVSKTNDFGTLRDTISMLLNNTAILNESSRENLDGKFGQILQYSSETLRLPKAALSMMQDLYVQELNAGKEENGDRFLSALTSLLSRSSEKSLPPGIDRTSLHDVTHSLLLDNSVFMPFHHIVLPAQVSGRFLFAQIWVEKQSADKIRQEGPGTETSPKLLYLTFDIQNLGYFEAALRLTGKRVDLSLSCPPSLERNHGQIRSDLSDILEKNGLDFGEVRLSTCKKPKVPHLILQKIAERKRVIDVTV